MSDWPYWARTAVAINWVIVVGVDDVSRAIYSKAISSLPIADAGHGYRNGRDMVILSVEFDRQPFGAKQFSGSAVQPVDERLASHLNLGWRRLRLKRVDDLQ